ncbi:MULTISPECIES: type IV secretory system conjugative DNA transfer family protein [Corynebacterium]|uniref:type IV secretory system conjugative DNA transfer family protein n=1 Tax=Corynebacterium TaxID=1716 RepID=UPI001CEF9A7B|nr:MULTISPECIES: type IV secretory system conjugative DNA transfer family protein [Corynebacterium]
MSGKNVRHSGSTVGPQPSTLFLLGLLIVAMCGVVALQLVSTVTDVGRTSWNPITALVLIIRGEAKLTAATGLVFLMLVSAAGGLAWLVRGKVKGTGRKRVQIDDAQRYLGGSEERSTLSKAHVQKHARGWFDDEKAITQPGLMFGHVPGKPKQEFWGSWEDLFLIVFGPRMGKTTSQVIPAIVDAPGAVVTTSNKRDIVDDTIALTSDRGQAWVFDPQKIARGFEQEKWFFDPLDSIRRDPEMMDASAEALADIFRCAALGDSSGGENAYWVNAGRELLASLLLAAALDDRPITDVYRWVTDPDDPTPRQILSEHPEWVAQNDSLHATSALPEVTKGGVYGQAKTMAAPLGRRAVAQWVTPTIGAQKFSAEEFVRAPHPTMYVLSKDGADNAAALTTALVAAIMQAAERYGEENGGRLPVPLIAALDEAANVVKWPELPNLYSHYGSRSIILMTILQSYSQGVSVWGEQGMEALWSAASILLYGGAVKDDVMLRKMEDLIGEATMRTTSVSRSSDGRSTSTSYQERKILTKAELAALPQWRAVVFSSKRRPVIAQLVPFWERSWPRRIKELLPSKKKEVKK